VVALVEVEAQQLAAATEEIGEAGAIDHIFGKALLSGSRR
jgi:hypothetical protein